MIMNKWNLLDKSKINILNYNLWPQQISIYKLLTYLL